MVVAAESAAEMRRGGKIPDYAALRPGMNVIDAVIKLIRSNPSVTRGLDHASRIYPTCALNMLRNRLNRFRMVHPLRKDFFPKRMDCNGTRACPSSEILKRRKSDKPTCGVKPGNDAYL